MYKFIRLLAAALAGLAALGGLRAQVTESPHTVAPGRFLLEMDALTLTLDRAPGASYTAFGAATTFLTTGLTQNLDLQVGAELFISQKIDLGGFTERDSGIGDVYLRTKWKFYEDRATGTAVALLPYVKLPTNSGSVGNDAIEGGLIVPWTTQLAGGFDVAAMAALDLLRNDADDGYDTNWHFSAYLSRPLTQAVGLYAEFGLGKSSGAAGTDGILGAGVTLAVSESTWWDFAVYRGIASKAADWKHVLRFNLGF